MDPNDDLWTAIRHVLRAPRSWLRPWQLSSASLLTMSAERPDRHDRPQRAARRVVPPSIDLLYAARPRPRTVGPEGADVKPIIRNAASCAPLEDGFLG